MVYRFFIFGYKFAQIKNQLKLKRVHLIAIGGAIMHNLAIALQRKGHHVS